MKKTWPNEEKPTKEYAYTWKWRTIIKESLQPNQRVRDCLEINNFKSYKPTKVEPEKEWKCREGWLISANVESQAAHPKKCIRKGFKISDPIPKKWCKYYHKKHEEERPKLFAMKWLIAPCMLHSNGKTQVDKRNN